MGKPIVIAGEFDATGVATGVNQANGHLGRLSKTAGTVGRTIAKGLAVAGVAVVGLAVATVGAASESQQSIGATKSVYGKYASSVVAESKRAADAVGLSANAYREQSTQLGAMLKNAGTPMKQLGKQTSELVGLGSDLAATFGGETKDAVAAIGSLMRGEADPIERYGVSIKQSDVNARLAAQGLSGLTGEALKQAEAQARLTLLYGQTSAAQGQFARESETFAGQTQRLSAGTANLKATIGTALLPVLTTFAGVINSELLPPVQAFAEQHGPAMAKQVEALGLAIGPLANGLIDKVSTGIAGLNSGASGADLSSLADSASRLGPVVQDAAAALPGLSDVLSVTSSVMAFAADHTDLLAKAMPFLVAGFVAVKVAQAAANVVAVLSLPTKIAEVVVNRQLVASNRALIASRGGVVAATTSQTAAENVGILTRARALVGMIVQRTAMVATAVATGAWAAAQWSLNAAMTANPIGLVIVGLVALGAGLVLAYKKSETFRTIVNGAFGLVKAGAGALAGVVSNNMGKIKTVVGVAGRLVRIYTFPMVTAFRVVIAAGRALASAISTSVGKVTSTVRSIKGKVTSAVAGFGGLLKGAGSRLIGGLISGITSRIKDVGGAMSKVAGKVKGFLPGSPVKEGPLTSWNNGGAGKRLMDQGLIAGVRSRLGKVKAAMTATAGAVAATMLPTALSPATASAPVTTNAYSSASSSSGQPLEITVKVEGGVVADEAKLGREIARYLRAYVDLGGRIPTGATS
ncbi:hypothetical protein [Aeromicrobium sp.]|uniref:hypothetical protein n=1 Tax=Aeromicrobium sp. TaxID=1871063 RepID=UPI0030BC0E1A